jgi:glutathione S-transferase
MLLAEREASFEFVTIDIGRGAHTEPTFLALHPFGKVPVLEHDAFVLYETRAILGYLDQVLPGAPLLSKDARERALAEQWISNEVAYFGPATLTLLYQLILGPLYGNAPDAAAVEGARQALARGLDVMERALASRAFFGSDSFGLADLCLMPGVQVMIDSKQSDLIESRPATAHWWTRVSKRPTWQSVLAKA